jgi:hypothetical protein
MVHKNRTGNLLKATKFYFFFAFLLTFSEKAFKIRDIRDGNVSGNVSGNDFHRILFLRFYHASGMLKYHPNRDNKKLK